MQCRFPTFLVVVCCGLAGCAQPNVGFRTASMTGPRGQSAKYSVFVPSDYPTRKSVPVILFLHGGGEAGKDGVKPTQVGIAQRIRELERSFPFLVVFPQAQERIPATFASWMPDQPDGELAVAVLNQVIRDFRCDAGRIYLTGISVGGAGVWQLAAAHPDRWAAIVPVCGIAPLTKAEKIKNIPCWCFHGAKDDAVDVNHSRRMIGELKRLGGDPRYTEYAEAGHDCWDKAYSSDELFNWLKLQSRK